MAIGKTDAIKVLTVTQTNASGFSHIDGVFAREEQLIGQCGNFPARKVIQFDDPVCGGFELHFDVDAILAIYRGMPELLEGSEIVDSQSLAFQSEIQLVVVLVQ